MRYTEYYANSKKHLLATLSILDSFNKKKEQISKYTLLELYYLSGYILEGAVVFLAYKMGNWTEKDDIKDVCNVAFTATTSLDFYRNGNRKTHKKLGNKYFIQSHAFQPIVKNLLRPNSAFDAIPYIGVSCPIDPDVESLIDNWNPRFRYVYEDTQVPSELNEDSLRRLLNTCRDIMILTFSAI